MDQIIIRIKISTQYGSPTRGAIIGIRPQIKTFIILKAVPACLSVILLNDMYFTDVLEETIPGADKIKQRPLKCISTLMIKREQLPQERWEEIERAKIYPEMSDQEYQSSLLGLKL